MNKPARTSAPAAPATLHSMSGTRRACERVRDSVKGDGARTWLRPAVTTSNMRATWPELPSRGGEATELLLLTTGCWNKCRNQMPGVVGRVMEQDDNRLLSRLGKSVEVLLKHDMTMVGLDGLISKEEKKD